MVEKHVVVVDLTQIVKVFVRIAAVAVGCVRYLTQLELAVVLELMVAFVALVVVVVEMLAEVVEFVDTVAVVGVEKPKKLEVLKRVELLSASVVVD